MWLFYYEVIKLRRIFIFISLVFIIASSAVFVTGCIGDGVVSIKGVAFEWINAPPNATSQIYITNGKSDENIEQTLKNTLDNIPKGITKLPLENVEITVANPKYPHFNIVKVKSNSIGEFNDYGGAGPGKFKIRVKATEEGYQEVYKDATHDTISHVIVVLLVKNKN
jgi:hypothetical protein